MKEFRSRLNTSTPIAAALLGALGMTALGCHPQNQDEVQQLRAEVAALAAEVEALKAQQAETPPPAAEEAPAVEKATAAAAPPPKPPWEEQIKAYKSEGRDKSWARLREAPLLKVATEHIKGSGASLQSVACKTSSCLIIVDVPKKTRKPYAPLGNPWAETDLTTHTKPTYGGRTRWSYLLSRHEKDFEKFGAERVDPLKLAREGGETRAAVATSAPQAEAPAAESKEPVPSPAKPAPAAVSSAKAEEPAAAGTKTEKTATAPESPAEKQPTAPAAPAKPTGKTGAKPESKTASKAPAKPAPPAAQPVPTPKSKAPTDVAAASEKPVEAAPSAPKK